MRNVQNGSTTDTLLISSVARTFGPPGTILTPLSTTELSLLRHQTSRTQHGKAFSHYRVATTMMVAAQRLVPSPFFINSTVW